MRRFKDCRANGDTAPPRWGHHEYALPQGSVEGIMSKATQPSFGLICPSLYNTLLSVSIWFMNSCGRTRNHFCPPPPHHGLTWEVSQEGTPPLSSSCCVVTGRAFHLTETICALWCPHHSLFNGDMGWQFPLGGELWLEEAAAGDPALYFAML